MSDLLPSRSDSIIAATSSMARTMSDKRGPSFFWYMFPIATPLETLQRIVSSSIAVNTNEVGSGQNGKT
jgi:hypothetical protein